MAELLTLQDLANGHLDVKALGEAANGDENTIVTTRTGNTYPSAERAINIMFQNGGLPAKPFATLAQMNTNGASLADGQLAQVYNETTNNGLYVKTAGAWVKSPYDPLVLAKADATTKSDMALSNAKAYSDGTSKHDSDYFLDRNVDADGEIYAYTDRDGSKYLSGLDGSIQDNLTGLNDKINHDGESGLIAHLKDNMGDTALALTADGALLVDDVVTSKGSINSFMVDAPKQENQVDLSNIYKKIEGYHSALDLPINNIQTLADGADHVGFAGTFAPVVTRISKTEFYLVYEIRSQGGDDYDPMKLVGRKLTYNATTKNMEVGAFKILADNGLTPEGVPFVFINPTVTYVERGINAGRIYVHCNYMNNPAGGIGRIYVPHELYSDDGGDTFTEPKDMRPIFPDFEDRGSLMVFGVGHGIQLKYGEHKNRLVLTTYTIHPLTPSGTRGAGAVTILSDDGGNTWVKGEYLDVIGLNEWQVCELPDGDIVMVSRQYSARNYAYRGYSKDGGVNFTDIEVINGVYGAGTKKGMISTDNAFDYSLPKLILISASSEYEAQEIRYDPHVWYSYDGGLTWSERVKIMDGVCQYAHLATLDEEHTLAVWGGGEQTWGNKIMSSVFNTKFLMEKK